jgi:hypothetical protein
VRRDCWILPRIEARHPLGHFGALVIDGGYTAQ